MANVRFVRTTKEKQIKREVYDNNALYFCTDSAELYRGAQLLSDGVRQVETYVDLPNFAVAADGILYYVKETGNAYLLNQTRDDWVQIVFAPVADIDSVSDEDADKYIPTVGAVRKALEGISVSGGSGVDYELPVATDTTLGGVTAAAKTDEMTQEIGVDENGKLWVHVPDVTSFVTQEYVNSKVETVEMQVGEIETRLETTEAQTNTVITQVGYVESQVEAVESKINTVESQIGTMETKIETMETKIEEVAGGLDPAETYIFDGGEI